VSLVLGSERNRTTRRSARDLRPSSEGINDSNVLPHLSTTRASTIPDKIRCIITDSVTLARLTSDDGMDYMKDLGYHAAFTPRLAACSQLSRANVLPAASYDTLFQIASF
jgi:hypothetical protein